MTGKDIYNHCHILSELWSTYSSARAGVRALYSRTYSGRLAAQNPDPTQCAKIASFLPMPAVYNTESWPTSMSRFPLPIKLPIMT